MRTQASSGAAARVTRAALSLALNGWGLDCGGQALSAGTLHSEKRGLLHCKEKPWVDVGVSQLFLRETGRFSLFRKHWQAVPQKCPRRHRRQAPGRRFDLLETVHRWVCWTTSISDPLSMVPPTMRVPPSA